MPELRLLDDRVDRFRQRLAHLVGLVSEHDDDVGRRRRRASRSSTRSISGLAGEQVQHFVAARAHPRSLAGGQDDRDQGAAYVAAPPRQLRVHWSEIVLTWAAGRGCPARIRTWIATSKVCCPTIGRPGTARAGRALSVPDGGRREPKRCARVLARCAATNAVMP